MFYLKVFERMIVLGRITKPKVIVGKFQMRYKYTFCLLNIVRADYHLPAKKKIRLKLSNSHKKMALYFVTINAPYL